MRTFKARFGESRSDRTTTCRRRHPHTPKASFGLVLVLLLAACLGFGCSDGENQAARPHDDGNAPQSGQEALDRNEQPLSIASLKGPTSVGLADMMKDDSGHCTFTVAGTADEIVPQITQGKVDVALIPANLAATLYRKTDGAIQVIDVNTLGVLYALSADVGIAAVSDLVDKTVYMTGKGTVPDYTLAALLFESGISPEDVNVEFKSEPAEVVAAVSANPKAVAILPQPYATAAAAKLDNLRVAFDLTEAWESATGGARGSLVTGVTVARSDFIDENPEAVAWFLDQHAASVQAVQDDPERIAEAVVELGIIDDAAIALKALPACNTVCITGQPMKDALSGYLEALYDQDAASVGGSLPDSGFYYLGESD